MKYFTVRQILVLQLLGIPAVIGQIRACATTCSNGNIAMDFGGSGTCTVAELNQCGFSFGAVGGASTSFWMRCCPTSSYYPGNACNGSWSAFCAASEPMMYFFEDVCRNGFMQFNVDSGFNRIVLRGAEVHRQNPGNCNTRLAAIERNGQVMWTQEYCDTCMYDVAFPVSGGDNITIIEGGIFAVSSVELTIAASAATTVTRQCAPRPLCTTVPPTPSPTRTPTRAPTLLPATYFPTVSPTADPTVGPTAIPTLHTTSVSPTSSTTTTSYLSTATTTTASSASVGRPTAGMTPMISTSAMVSTTVLLTSTKATTTTSPMQSTTSPTPGIIPAAPPPAPESERRSSWYIYVSVLLGVGLLIAFVVMVVASGKPQAGEEHPQGNQTTQQGDERVITNPIYRDNQSSVLTPGEGEYAETINPIYGSPPRPVDITSRDQYSHLSEPQSDNSNEVQA